MPLLEGTLVAALFLIPGYFSLALALSPRSRAIRQSSLGTRIFGLLVLSSSDWFLALLVYDLLPVGGSHCRDLASLMIGSDDQQRTEILAAMLRFPAPLLWGIALMIAVSLMTGGICALLHHAALTGCAIRNYGLKIDGLPLRTKAWCWISNKVDWILHGVRLSDLFQPLGAGYWLVLLKAAQILQRSSAAQSRSRRRNKSVAAADAVQARDAGSSGEVARVYVDVVQGDEVDGEGRVGVLYSGTVKHLVCETDGNVVFVLLTEAKRWSRGNSSSPASIGRGKPIENSLALGLDGRNIRNISFRLIEKSPIDISAARWPK